MVKYITVYNIPARDDSHQTKYLMGTRNETKFSKQQSRRAGRDDFYLTQKEGLQMWLEIHQMSGL